MLISFAEVKDLNNFLNYLKTSGIEVEEYMHTVLADSSELEVIVCKRNGIEIAYVVVHYIDSHYAVLSSLGSNASDREILEALLSVDKSKIWRIPVEPVMFTTNNYNFIRIVYRYTDRVPEEGNVYLDKYLNSGSNNTNIIDIDMLLNIASTLKGSERHGKTIHS